MYHLRNTFGKGLKRKDDALKEFVSPGIVDVLTQREGHLLAPFACCSHKVINVLIGLSTVDMNLCDFKFASQIRWFLWLDVTSQLGKISRFSAITLDESRHFGPFRSFFIEMSVESWGCFLPNHVLMFCLAKKSWPVKA